MLPDGRKVRAFRGVQRWSFAALGDYTDRPDRGRCATQLGRLLVRHLEELNVRTSKVLGVALVLVATCVSAETGPSVDLATRAQQVLEANPREHLAAIAEIESVSSDDDPLSFSRVRLLEILGQEVTKAAVARSGDRQLLLVAHAPDRSDIRVGDKVIFVGVPLWMHGSFSGYSPLAYKRNPSPSDVSGVKGAVKRKSQPGV
jgi:hypothetical protein